MKELDFTVIGQRIKEIRCSKKLTQEYLANATGVNVSHISNIETNKVKVSLTLLVGICNALDVTMDYLLINEYHLPTSVEEKELFNAIKDMPKDKLETLLKIAKVLQAQHQQTTICHLLFCSPHATLAELQWKLSVCNR